MAKRRCFSVDFIESIPFRKLSNEAKALYMGFIAHADDEGVVINPSIPLCLYNLDENTTDELIEKEFVIKLNDLLIIKHWYIHNKLYGIKKRPSIYSEELEELNINDRYEYE